ncbi:MAG: diguanylate cyclase [Anaerolineales bacterium]
MSAQEPSSIYPELNLLIVEDNDDYRDMLRRRAEPLVSNIEAVSNYPAATAAVRNNDFDVLLLDIHVPGGTGLDLLARAKRKDPDVQAVILTGQASVETAVEALRLGAFDYLMKPFDSIQVLDLTLKRALDHRSLILSNRRMKAELEQMAVTDPLTGLYNRRKLEQVLEDELARVKRYKRRLSTIMIDVDNLKELNDELGHPAGDEVLRHMAELIRSSVRTSDVPVRVGGDEFIVILPETGIEQALKIAERLVDEAQSQASPGKPLFFSIGIVEWGPALQTVDQLLAEADRALYEAKEAGGRHIAAGEQLIPAWG